MKDNRKKKIIISSIVLIVIVIIVFIAIFLMRGSIFSVKVKIKSHYDITEGSQEIIPKVSGCEITLENSDSLKRITREKEDQEIELVFNAKCGTDEEKIKASATIKKSPYTYEATANENLQNYDVIIEENNKTIKYSGGVYALDGSWLSDIIDGKAIINNMDIKDYPDFKIMFEDKKTIYVISKN